MSRPKKPDGKKLISHGIAMLPAEWARVDAQLVHESRSSYVRRLILASLGALDTIPSTIILPAGETQ